VAKKSILSAIPLLLEGGVAESQGGRKHLTNELS